MADRYFYKYTCVGDNGIPAVTWGVSKLPFEEEQKDHIANGFRVDQDSIEEIEFDANYIQSLCDKLNELEINDGEE